MKSEGTTGGTMYKNGIKRLIDILVSGLGIVVLSPVFLILYQTPEALRTAQALVISNRTGNKTLLLKAPHTLVERYSNIQLELT